MTRRWRQRPEGSNWGRFGDDDQVGTMNLVGPEQVLKGVSEVKTGRTFSLSLPLDYPGGSVLHPRRKPPRRFANLRGGANEGAQCFCYPLSRDNPFHTDVVSDDVALLYLQYSTQWDGLAHFGAEFDADADGRDEMVFYNGFRAGRDVLPAQYRAEGAAQWDTYENPRAEALGIENLARHGAQGRGVLIDLHRHFGTAHHAVNFDELMNILKMDDVTVEKGDMVCLYTGLDQVILSMNRQPTPQGNQMCSGLDGSDPRLLDWISSTGVAALISDNFGVEIPPATARTDRHSMWPLHQHCIFKNGMHLGEMWYLHELASWLAENSRSRFLLTAPPLDLPGAAGSPTTPIATV
jgi:kynurenine formamidase